MFVDWSLYYAPIDHDLDVLPAVHKSWEILCDLWDNGESKYVWHKDVMKSDHTEHEHVSAYMNKNDELSEYKK